MNKPIGLFGGTFDPVHKGHLELALAALQNLDLASIEFIPCYRSPFKNQPIASAEDRFKMLELAIADEPLFSLNDYEVKRQNVAYTVETLQAMRKKLGERVPLCWIMSMDAFINFDFWHQWEEIPKLAHLAIANRPGSETIASPNIQKLLTDQQIFEPDLLKSSPAGKIIFFNMPPNSVSATEVRALIKSGKDASNLVPKIVWEYIRQNKLYL
jgi:nicotinate-nucleotide adenylyltransferase